MKTRRANYQVILDSKDKLIIQDLGPWDVYPTVTNAAEHVVEELVPRLAGRRLFYVDSDGSMDELVIKDGQFQGFSPVRPSSVI